MKTQFFFILLLLICQISILIAKTNLVRNKCNCLNKLGTIQLTVDNYLDQISINGVSISMTQKGLFDWTIVKTFELIINAGDLISISGRNEGDVTASNPAGILATIKYFDQSGNSNILNTGAGWTCNGRPALLQGENGSTSTPWYGGSGALRSTINLHAQFIWDPLQLSQATCSITIPGHCKKY